MKKVVACTSLLFVFLLITALANADLLTTVVGNGATSPSIGEQATNIAIESYANRVDRYGNIYLTDTGAPITSSYGSGYLRVNSHGEVDRIVNDPVFDQQWLLDDLAVDADGNVFLAANSHYKIYKITPCGTVSVYAGNGNSVNTGDGGLATAAGIGFPETISLDLEGNLYIGTSGTHAIRKVDRNGIISTLYSDSTSRIETIYADGLGNVYFYNGSYKIKKVTPQGNVSDFAGNGTNGSTGDGGLATEAEISPVHGITGDIWGNIYFTDETGNSLRKVDASGIITTVSPLSPSYFYSRISTDNDGMVYLSNYITPSHVLKLAFSPQLETLSNTMGSPGETLILTGRYFTSRGTGGGVTFNGLSAPILSWNNEVIVCTVPQGTTTGDVVVSTPDGQQSNGINFKLR